MEEASYPNWFDLSFELREKIIDEMDTKTRCRFARCSKQCEKEAKESNNYLDGMNVYTSWGFSNIQLLYSNDMNCSIYEVYHQRINCERLENLIMNTDGLVDGNVEETVASVVQENVEKYRKCLRKLEIKGHDYNLYLPKINFNIFEKLETIKLNFDNVADFSSFIGFDKILRTKYVNLPQFNFTFDQITKFEGSKLECSSNEMDEENVKKYLKMLKNGEVHQNIRKMYINVEKGKTVNFENVIEGLDAQDFESSEWRCKFTMESKTKKNESYEIQVNIPYYPWRRLKIIQ